jgi:Flp pilus assembly protein TadG
MSKRKPARPGRRRAILAPLAAVLMVPLLGMVAFAVDMGWMTHTQNELQSAADAAALAGARQLLDGYVKYYSPSLVPTVTILGQTPTNIFSDTVRANVLSTAKANATTYAKNYASYNAAGDVSSLKLLDSDIEFGYTDSSGNYTALPTYTGYPNTVKVTLRRDSTANGPLPLFFAPVLGVKTANLTATASATVYGGVIDSFKINPNFNSGILPVAFDVNLWNNFLKTGQSPDGTIVTDANGIPQIQVYPSIKYSGDFGMLSLDQLNDGASTISGWVDNGVPSTDLQHEIDAGLLPLSSHDPTKWDWEGNSGLKTSDIHTVLQGHVGDTFLLPLFKPVNDGSLDPTDYEPGIGNGGNYYFNIVQFVGIKITKVDNNSIWVVPYAMTDPNAVFPSVAPAGPPTTSSSLVTTFAAPKLTR